MTDEVSTKDLHDARTIWDYHLMHHQLEPVDVAIGLGSHDLGVATFAAKLYHEQLFTMMVFSGANSRTHSGTIPARRGRALPRTRHRTRRAFRRNQGRNERR